MRLAFVLAACLLALPAAAGNRVHAPTPVPKPRPALTGNPVQDIQNAINGGASAAAAPGSAASAEGGPLGQALAQALSAPFQQLANLINSDLDGAITLSTSVPELQDGNGQQCWMAMKAFGKVVKAHPLPLTGKAVTDLEAARLMTMAANRLCGEPHCNTVFSDLANAATQAASLVPGAQAVQVPSLSSLCAHVPTVVVAAPVNTPAPAAATPTSPQ